ncbi:hypothetical protein ABIF96_007536 [Bradyrhizobium ottawaense]
MMRWRKLANSSASSLPTFFSMLFTASASSWLRRTSPSANGFIARRSADM